MVSADAGRGRPACAGIACTMRGWNNPRPISIRLPSDGPGALREDVRRNIQALIPRCEELDRSLPDRMRGHRAYLASKIHRDFPLEMGQEIETGARL